MLILDEGKSTLKLVDYRGSVRAFLSFTSQVAALMVSRRLSAIPWVDRELLLADEMNCKNRSLLKFEKKPASLIAKKRASQAVGE